MESIDAIRWQGDHLQLLDQRLLPGETRYLALQDAAAVADAIRDMVVRGAPAIGISAAYGAALAARALAVHAPADWQAAMAPALERLAASRPTAVNLFWALDRVRAVIAGGGDIPARLGALACAIHAEDLAMNQRMGEHGAALLPQRARVYTHCNTGALATGGHGTALGVIRSAHRQGRIDRVFAGETRPWWQGARLTAWELQREGIPFDLCVEGAAGLLLRREGIHWVIVGADRIAANGDVANKIGTYNLAVLARHHGVRMMVAAPSSTFDLDIADGDAIPIEERAATEITHVRGQAIAPQGCSAVNPAFDITPASLIDAIVTEHGVIENPDRARVAHHFEQAGALP